MPSRRASGSLLLSLVVFALARGVVFFGFGEYISDVRLYHDVAELGVFSGEHAYSGFFFPYPPLSLPFVYLPIGFGRSLAAYRTAFRLEMAAVDVLCLLLILRLVRRLGGAEKETRLAVLVYSLGGLALGHLLYDRLDLLVAACFLGFALTLTGARRPAAVALPLWLGALVKLVPLLWAPLDWLAADLEVRGARARWGSLLKRFAVGLTPVALVLFGWNAFTGGALFGFLGEHAERGIELESLWATPILLGRLASGAGPAPVDNRFGAQHLAAEAVPGLWVWLSKGMGLVLLAAFYLCVWRILRRRQRGDPGFRPAAKPLFLAALAALLLIVATQRVLSPQYFIWVLPALAVWLGLGRAALAVPVVGAVFYLTYEGFSRGYWRFVAGDPYYVLVYAARNALLLLLTLLVLARALEALRAGGGRPAGGVEAWREALAKRLGRSLALGLLLASGAVGGAFWWRLRPAEERFHAIVLLTLDTARGDHFDWDEAGALPSIARLFASGLRFDQAVALAPVTRPSHATIFTGRSPLDHGVLTNLNRLPARALTLAERLQRRRLRTAAFVGSSILGSGAGLEQGFDHFDDLVRVEYAPMYYERSAEETTDRALAWLEWAGHRPFFLWVHYFDPHAPYEPPADLRPPGSEVFESVTEWRATATVLGRLNRREVSPPEGLEDYFRKLYAAELTSVDRQIGRLSGWFERQPWGGNVLWILTADHGEELAEHGHWGHDSSLYDGVMRVPLAMTWPGAHAGRIGAQVPNGGVAAAVLELLGENTPPGLLPSVLDVGSRGGGQLLVGQPRPDLRPWAGAYRRPPWKYIFRASGEDSLFDLGADPGETRDLAGQRAGLAAELRSIVERRALPVIRAYRLPPVDERTRRQLRVLGYLQ